jgi:BioD-like phosphotransacetylase family protein
VEGMYERSIVEPLNAKVIIVEDYSKGPAAKSDDAYKQLGEYLLGVVLNKVPLGRLEKGEDKFSSQFSEAGVTMLGALPEDRILFTLSVGELAEYLRGEILNSVEKSQELVENFMLGAMTVDPGPEYFSRKANKAVVVKGERADMQMAALETAVRCLILSGDIAPIPAVRYRAKDKNVPIIVVESDTTTTVLAIEEALGKAKLNQAKKLPRLTEIMEKRFSFQSMYRELGLAS